VAHTIAEADWKVLRRLHPLALERFCERVLAEIEQVTKNHMQSAHQRYADVFRIVEQRDRDIARLFNDPKRSHALTMLIGIRSEGLLTDDEFSTLSPETRNAIQMLLDSA
jgi:energy-coupling factor transporter ATP-binding protein EcfA2